MIIGEPRQRQHTKAITPARQYISINAPCVNTKIEYGRTIKMKGTKSEKLMMVRAVNTIKNCSKEVSRELHTLSEMAECMDVEK